MIDLGGRMVVPGFNDTHIHVRIRCAADEPKCKSGL